MREPRVDKIDQTAACDAPLRLPLFYSVRTVFSDEKRVSLLKSLCKHLKRKADILLSENHCAFSLK